MLIDSEIRADSETEAERNSLLASDTETDSEYEIEPETDSLF